MTCSGEASLADPDRRFKKLVRYLADVPAIGNVSHGFSDDHLWWVKFVIDIEHRLAWSVVQELGCVLNYLSLNERLPTVFYPVSPAPYLNGGPKDFLSWVLESKTADFTPDLACSWLEGRLPRPVNDLDQWKYDDSN